MTRRGTYAFVEGLEVGTGVSVREHWSARAAGDFFRRPKRGILRLEELADEGRTEECCRPRKSSESSYVFENRLAEGVEGREVVVAMM